MRHLGHNVCVLGVCLGHEKTAIGSNVLLLQFRLDCKIIDEHMLVNVYLLIDPLLFWALFEALVM